MTLGRVLGWLLIAAAVITASAEGVVALGTGAYDSIATGDLWTLITGHHPLLVSTHAAWPEAIGAVLLGSPAWTVVGAAGAALVFACRPRRRRAAYREASMRFSSTFR